MKRTNALVAGLLLTASLASAGGPGAVEPVGSINAGLNLIPVNPLSVLYLQRAQLLRDQMDLTVAMEDEKRYLHNDLAHYIDEYSINVPVEKDNQTKSEKAKTPEQVVETIRKSRSSGVYFYSSSSHRNIDMSFFMSQVRSVDKKQRTLDQLKTILDDLNTEIKRLSSPQVSKNPSGAGGATESL